ncbi:MAG TPA: hypothetical protein IAD02_00060 [Candidatus Enterousia intestinigallinarum]|uniref:Outer membrane protein beta-barrel domain-containing protein n=1 Tax=Candidatus Enterousia intestinigallinarum TaxID=2840790 RepID=A0A9D1JW11_9PROT|nr:hypothetical protein [Candidatus Enterousia intestinigallinarum]
MKCRNLLLLPVLSCLMFGAARANWEYPGYYVGEGAYTDDGSRFIVSVRGGASVGMGTIKNEIGELTPLYYMSPDGSVIMSELGYYQCTDRGQCADYIPAGYVNLGDLPATKDFESFGFAAGASLGWTIPNSPQWRIELGWDHISESEYNASPFIEGEAPLFGGSVSDVTAVISSGAVQSKVVTDIISVMAFYDFFDGIQKPTRTVIPYIGFGVGYADIKTTLQLSDPYGDLSGIYELLPYGVKEQDDSVIQFYRSELSSANIAGVLALGLSYGITENMFFDIGARVAYIPRIRWALSNEDASQYRDWFSAENAIYANIMLSLRFEF